MTSLIRTLAIAQLLLALPITMATAQDERVVTEADMPRIPHTEVKDVLSTFKVADGFGLELVAAEPLVSDPVAACFDAQGRMFVAEMHGYPFSQEPTQLNPDGGGLKDAGIIRMLEDTDGDGTMDRSFVFADKLSWPTSVLPYDGGIFVMAPKYLYYLKDTDGDNQADVREIVLEGFGRNNVQSVANGLIWGLDNKIYFAAGRNPKTLLHRGDPLFPVSGADLRFDPRTEEFELATGGVQFGHSRDIWGTRFVCSNSNHMQQIVHPQHYITRNPYLVASGMIRSIATDGASARVFRLSPPEPWRIVRQKWRALDKGYRLVINDDGGWEFIPLDPSKPAGVVPTEYPVGFFTSATGITLYSGDAYPAKYLGDAFVGDVGGNLVHRKNVNSNGHIYTSKRADEGVEFIQSKDNWFRPVNFLNAPDGTLYVLDMYRETVEHPYSIPQEIKKFLHLTSGKDRGRIYRVVREDMNIRKPVNLDAMTNAELVNELSSSNGWNRDTAQRLLVERDDKTVQSALNNMLLKGSSSVGRLHGLYTLDGLDLLTPEHILAGLQDEHPRVKAHAIRLSERFLHDNVSLVREISQYTSHASEHVRIQIAYSLGAAKPTEAMNGLLDLALDSKSTPEIKTALLSSVGEFADQFTLALVQRGQQNPQLNSIALQSAILVGSDKSDGSTYHVLQGISELPTGVQQTVLRGLGEGLSRRGTTLRALITSEKAPDNLADNLAVLFTSAEAIAKDSKAALPNRISAMQLLAFSHTSSTPQVLQTLLTPQTPQTIQLQVVQTLGAINSGDLSEGLLLRWKGYSPLVRREVIDVLLQSTNNAETILASIEAGVIQRVEIERDKKQLLLQHPNKAIQSRSQKLFGNEANTDRAAVVQAHQSVLELSGRPTQGREVFRKKCSLCHQAGDLGTQVAPNLASVKNKSAADLLISILDPNREAQPNFNVYTVITLQGKVLTGIIASETATSITLKRAEGKQDVVLRSNIDELISSGVSLMPVGLEKELSKQDLADVIAFIKQSKELK
tara:strand:- start:3269 stop:6331 length:3063 start_codon:yes stop_codon:yes gene_type:complete